MAISSHSKFYPELVSRNQHRLISICDDYIRLLNKDISFLNIQMLKTLHYHSMAIIDDSAGEFRKVDVHISYSKHEPPEHKEVPQLVFNCLDLIKKHWDDDSVSSFSLMAYALWRINWIHPFEDGNGRTSRALTYIIHSSKFDKDNFTLTLPNLIEQFEDRYQKVLRKTDELFNGDDAIDEMHLMDVTEYLFNILSKNVKLETKKD